MDNGQNDEFEQMRKDEIFALCEIFSDTCRKEDDNTIAIDIQEPEFNNKKIKFRVLFIDDYPKNSKPDYNLVADWLPSDLIKSIKNELDKIWTEMPNQPIVYLWIESIKENVLKWLEKSNNEDEIDETIKKVEEKFSELDMFNKNWKDSKSHSKDEIKEEIFDFHHGEPLIVKKSVFQAHLLHIDDESKIPLARKQLMQHKRVKEATHNIWSYRIFKQLGDRTVEHSNYDDDGETQAGSRLHLLLQLTDSKNVLVVVSRYFGGIKLGPDRFKLINEVAKNLLEEQGFISRKDSRKQKGKKTK